MQKFQIKKFFLTFLFTFALFGCDSQIKTTETISNNEITATGEFEEGTIFKSNRITVDSEEYEELGNRVDLSQFDGLSHVIYEFSLEKDGKAQQAKKDVTITLPKPFVSEDGFVTYHVKKDNAIEELETKVEGENISFTTSSFSPFIITGKTPLINPTHNFLVYADTETQGKIIVNKEEKASYAATLENGDEVVLTALPNAGYEFLGWFKGSKASGSNQRYDEFKEEAYITFNGERIEIYARFMPIDYKIAYELNGGVLNEDLITSYNVESNDIILPTPTKTCFKFEGWKNKDKIVTKISKGTTGDITLIAAWTQSVGLMRTIEITKDVIGEVELGTKTILSKADYVVRQDGIVINGENLKEENGIVTIEYKQKSSSDEAYSTSMPTELGEYEIRVRIGQSKTTPFYKEAVSSPKEFSMINRVIKTKFNVLGNYWYDKTTLGPNKIVKYDFINQNVLELEDVVGGEQKISGYQNTEIPLANLVFKEYTEKYTEIRIGSKDGIAIGRFVMFGMKHFDISEYDESGKYTGQHLEYFGICQRGEVKDVFLSRISFELVPNVEGYTDSEGNWICEEKNLDVCTYTHFTNDDETQKNISFEVHFYTSRYNQYEDDPLVNEYSRVQNDASNNIEKAYFSFAPINNLKYDVEISGDVEIYRVSRKDRKFEKVKKYNFMTIQYLSEYDNNFDASFYVFVMNKGAQVTVYNGKAFLIENKS